MWWSECLLAVHFVNVNGNMDALISGVVQAISISTKGGFMGDQARCVVGSQNRANIAILHSALMGGSCTGRDVTKRESLSLPDGLLANLQTQVELNTNCNSPVISIVGSNEKALIVCLPSISLARITVSPHQSERILKSAYPSSQPSKTVHSSPPHSASLQLKKSLDPTH